MSTHELESYLLSLPNRKDILRDLQSGQLKRIAYAIELRGWKETQVVIEYPEIVKWLQNEKPKLTALLLESL